MIITTKQAVPYMFVSPIDMVGQKRDVEEKGEPKATDKKHQHYHKVDAVLR